MRSWIMLCTVFAIASCQGATVAQAQTDSATGQPSQTPSAAPDASAPASNAEGAFVVQQAFSGGGVQEIVPVAPRVDNPIANPPVDNPRR